jgi:mono/diheme cytochrome c family protein
MVPLLLSATLVAGARADDDGAFREHVAPIFEQHCVRCHQGEKPKGGLSLTDAQRFAAGGESGAAIEPGKPESSLLVQHISGQPPEMPKDAEPLTAEQVAAVARWVAAGGRWPADLVLSDKRAIDAHWWSLVPRQATEPPAIDDPWLRTPIDAFILFRLRAEGLSSSPEADRRTLIRRLTYDLHGLPPTPEEVEAFENDPGSDAYQRLLERLLASPRYGERWGRHWLDVVHYGESHGYDKDKPRPHAWPYRDYVIASFNADKPYDRFVAEQIAGDVLYPADPQATVATGFIAAGPWDFVGHVELREGTVDKLIARSNDRDDMVAGAMSTFVSMTVHCARCHDHKFDPIRQQDYYGLQAVFAGVDRADRSYQVDAAVEQARRELAARKSELARQLADANQAAADASGEAARPEIAELQRALADVEARLASLPPQKLVYAAARDFAPQGTFTPPRGPRPVYLLARGDVRSPGPLVQPDALACIEGPTARFALADPDDEGQRRAALARWLTDPRNALVRRSIVNRVWHYHFGQGIVDTPNDFGRMGSLPTHPELLEWLAGWFADHGHSLKALHRLILNSAVYRQASADRADFAARDAGNRFLWRMNRARLDAESIRDAMLFVSGKLDLAMGGPSVQQFFFKDDHSPVYDYARFDVDDPRSHRRSVYRFLVRSVPDPFMECLDCADPSILTPKRSTTLTSIQALALLNNPFCVRQAEHLAERVRAAHQALPQQVAAAFRRALSRPPTDRERAALADYAGRFGLAAACRVIFNSNEFVFVD